MSREYIERQHIKNIE